MRVCYGWKLSPLQKKLLLWRTFHENLSWSCSWLTHFQRVEIGETSDSLFENLSWTWWRHQMETFSALLAICAGNSPVPGEFPTQRPVTWSFDVFFDLRQNKRLSKQWWGWWFKTPSRPLWRHRNEVSCSDIIIMGIPKPSEKKKKNILYQYKHREHFR